MELNILQFYFVLFEQAFHRLYFKKYSIDDNIRKLHVTSYCVKRVFITPSVRVILIFLLDLLLHPTPHPYEYRGLFFRKGSSCCFRNPTSLHHIVQDANIFLFMRMNIMSLIFTTHMMHTYNMYVHTSVRAYVP